MGTVARRAQRRQSAVRRATDPMERDAATEALAQTIRELRDVVNAHKKTIDNKYAGMNADLEVARAITAIAPSTAIPHLTRYETMHSREFERAMKELHRLQRDRLKASTASTTPSTQLHRAG